MGDELHNRHSASSSLFANAMAVAMAQTDLPHKGEMIGTLKYITNHDLIFLGLAMAAGKAIADPARDIEYSTVVTAMCRNGVEFGIRVSGLGDKWFTAPAPAVDGLYLPGYSAQDAGLDMGDSAITETVGWGGFVLGGAPGILSLVGGTPEEALAYSREMRKITVDAPHLSHACPGLCGHSHRHRHPPGSADGHHAHHRHRHRSQAPGLSQDRRRAAAGADGLLQEGADGVRRPTRFR